MQSGSEMEGMASPMRAVTEPLDAAIARHQRHMEGTEATDEASQQQLMDEIMQAREALENMGSPDMPAMSQAQRRMMAIAEHEPEKLHKKNRGVLSMMKRQMHEYASTPEQGLPKRKSLKAKMKRKHM